MKAETLLRLLKKSVLCLFLCVFAKDGFGQVSDSALISFGVTGSIVELATSYEKEFSEGINLSGDSSIIRYIPTYYRKNDSKHRYWLEDLVTSIKGDKLSIQYNFIIGIESDMWSATTTNVVLSMDSLRKNYVVPIYPEEESFWDDALQPILVTAGAAAVIALFFFVKF